MKAVWRSLISKSVTISLITVLAVPFTPPVYASYRGPTQIAVLELHRTDTPPEHTQKTTDRFREELTRYSNLKILSRPESQEILIYHRPAIEEAAIVTPTQTLVDRCKRAYFALHLGQADRFANAAIVRSLEQDPLQRDYQALVEAYIMKGIIAMAQNRINDAEQAFAQVVVYHPDVVLNDDYFAPSVIQRLSAAKERGRQCPTGSLAITTQPKAANVYINDIYYGASPVKASGLQEGEHRVTIKAANYSSQSKVVTVKADRTVPVKLTVPWKGKKIPYSPDRVGFYKEQFETMEQLTSVAAAAANQMHVEKLILIELEQRDGQDTVRAYIVDRRLATFHRTQSVVVKDIKTESPEASAALGQNVLDEMNQNIMKDPKTMSAAPYYGDVMLVGEERESLLKNPWFWVAIGTAAAVAGVAIGLAVTAGGAGIGAISVQIP